MQLFEELINIQSIFVYGVHIKVGFLIEQIQPKSVKKNQAAYNCLNRSSFKKGDILNFLRRPILGSKWAF